MKKLPPIVIDGETYSHVTQIASLYPKPWKEAWQRKHGFEKTDKVSDDSTAFGSYIHSLIYKDSQKEPFKIEGKNEEEILRARKCLTVVQNWREMNEVECIQGDNGNGSTLIYSRNLKVAGHYDEKSWAKGRKYKLLTDFKTGKNISGEHEIQLGGYSCLLREQGEIFDKGCLLYLEAETTPHWYSKKYLKKLELLFLKYVSVFNHYKEFEKFKRENSKEGG